MSSILTVRGSVVIAGSRGFGTDTVQFPVRYIDAAVKESRFHIDEVVSGTADGADSAGERWADAHGVPVQRLPAFWNACAQADGWARADGGMLRTGVMARYADGVLAFWDDQSPGTRGMIRYCRNADVPLSVVRYADEPGPPGYIDGVSEQAATVVGYAKRNGLSRDELDSLADRHGVELTDTVLALFHE